MMPPNLEIEALVAIASCSASAVTVRLCSHRSVILEAHSAATAPPGLQYRPTDRNRTPRCRLKEDHVNSSHAQTAQ